MEMCLVSSIGFLEGDHLGKSDAIRQSCKVSTVWIRLGDSGLDVTFFPTSVESQHLTASLRAMQDLGVYLNVGKTQLGF